MRRRNVVIVILVIAVVAAGVGLAIALEKVYQARLELHEKQMKAVMEKWDKVEFEKLVNSWPCPVKARDDFGRTPLIRAASMGREDLVKRLLAHGADVNASDNNGTALFWAAMYGHIEVVKLLVEAGAEVSPKCEPGDVILTPLRAAIYPGGLPSTPKEKEIVEYLIAHGADVNEEYPPLSMAASRCDMEIAKLLLEHGANVNGRAGHPLPLHEAARCGKKEMVELLIAHGADVNQRGAGGWTPLFQATLSGGKDVMELLVAKGADVNARDRHGMAPLHWWARVRLRGEDGDNTLFFKTAEILISHGADVNARDDEGKTPLHWAVPGQTQPDVMGKGSGVTGSKQTVEYLIAHGADVNAKDKEGKTPLTLSIEYKDEAVAEMLRKAGAR